MQSFELAPVFLNDQHAFLILALADVILLGLKYLQNFSVPCVFGSELFQGDFVLNELFINCVFRRQVPAGLQRDVCKFVVHAAAGQLEKQGLLRIRLDEVSIK